MTRRERVVVEVAVDHRRPETFGEGDGFGHRIAHHHTTPADDDGELGLGEHVGRSIEAGLAARTAVEDHRRRDLDVDVTVEAIARDVELGRPDLRHRPVEAASGDLRHPVLVGDVPLVLHELLEHGQLVGLLETTQALPHGAGLRSDHHDGAVGPERCCDRSDTVGDAGAVLADHHTVLAADPGIPSAMWAAPCSCTTGTSSIPAGAKMSMASMNALPMMPNVVVTPLATIVSTKASEGVMRVIGILLFVRDGEYPPSRGR